jgi:hypothetical protein
MSQRLKGIIGSILLLTISLAAIGFIGYDLGGWREGIIFSIGMLLVLLFFFFILWLLGIK